MKIHFYTVEPPNIHDDMARILDQIGKMSISEREHDINGKTVFLEKINGENNRYEMDFTQRRVENGPGYSRKGKPTVDFLLEKNAGFGEQTAAIWSSGYLAVQYNHYGVRPSTIEHYLQKILHSRESDQSGLLSINPVIDKTILAKFFQSNYQTKLSFTTDIDAISDPMADNVALSTVLNIHERTSACRIKISLSYGDNKRSGILQGIKEIVEGLLKHEGVPSIKVGIKNDLDEAVEVLDLVKHRVQIEVPDKKINRTAGGRFDYQSRISAIRPVFLKWVKDRSRE